MKTNLTSFPIGNRTALCTRFFFFLMIPLLGITLLSGCQNAGSNGGDEEATEVEESDSLTTLANSFVLYPPHDVNSTDPSKLELAFFAWREFFALNWQSDWNSSSKSRGNPDANWNYKQPGPFPSQPLVWETYAHRTELSPASAIPTKAFNSDPAYSFFKGNYSGMQGGSTYFNCLDEDNEIGSCYLFSFQTPDSLMVMYQAKANAAEYNYLMSYGDSASLGNAINATKSNIQNNKYYYPANPKDNCDCPEGVFCLPCGEASGGEGAIEVKTAWREPTANDNLNDYFHREVIYFEPGPNGTHTLKTGTFLLIGMHIIHKTANMPEFIFATWEHNSVTEASQDYHYITIAGDPDAAPGTVKEVTRIHPVDNFYYQTSTDAVHDALRELNSESVWLNYNLVGVQAQLANYDNRNDVSSYFLANFVIESDVQLGDFHGTFADPQDTTGTEVNVLKVSENQFYTMGGCKGCHGRAQYSGSDFSFLVGSGNSEPDDYYEKFETIKKLVTPKAKATSAKK